MDPINDAVSVRRDPLAHLQHSQLYCGLSRRCIYPQSLQTWCLCSLTTCLSWVLFCSAPHTNVESAFSRAQSGHQDRHILPRLRYPDQHRAPSLPQDHKSSLVTLVVSIYNLDTSDARSRCHDQTSRLVAHDLCRAAMLRRASGADQERGASSGNAKDV